MLKIDRLPDYAGAMHSIAFIVGTGRCGSTLLGQVLNAHSRICVPHELQLIVSIENGERLHDKFLSGEFQQYDARALADLIRQRCPYNFDWYFDYVGHLAGLQYPQTDLRALLSGMFDHICHSYKKEIFIEQTPWYGQRLHTLKELFPAMKVIHLVRDGRDVSISYARTPWWSRDVMANVERWTDEVRTIRAFGGANPESFMELRYEDLMCSPQAEVTRTLEFLGAQFEPRMLLPENLIDYYFYFKGESKKYQSKNFNSWDDSKKSVFFKDSVYGWKASDDNDFSHISARAKETLRLFGYEA